MYHDHFEMRKNTECNKLTAEDLSKEDIILLPSTTDMLPVKDTKKQQSQSRESIAVSEGLVAPCSISLL